MDAKFYLCNNTEKVGATSQSQKGRGHVSSKWNAGGSSPERKSQEMNSTEGHMKSGVGITP